MGSENQMHWATCPGLLGGRCIVIQRSRALNLDLYLPSDEDLRRRPRKGDSKTEKELNRSGEVASGKSDMRLKRTESSWGSKKMRLRGDAPAPLKKS